MSLVLILFFLEGILCFAANLILPLVSRWEVTKLTFFLQNFLGFCCFECRVWPLVRCSLTIFFGSAGGRPRRSNDGFVLERIRFTLSECGNVKSCKLNVSNKWIIFYPVFPCSVSIEFCFGQLPQMAAIKKKKNCSTSSYFQHLSVKFILFWFWPQPIKRHETDIQKWLWPGLVNSASSYTPLLISLRASRASIAWAVHGFSGMETRFAQQKGNLFAHMSKCSEEVPRKIFHFYVNYQHLQPAL